MPQLKALYIWTINIFDWMKQYRYPLVASHYKFLNYLDIVTWPSNITLIYLLVKMNFYKVIIKPSLINKH